MKINEIMSLSNRKFAGQIKSFRIACENAGIKPTKRQAAKYKKGKGLAYKTKSTNK